MHPPLAASNVFFRTWLHESIKRLCCSGMQPQQPGTLTYSHISSLLISRRLTRPRFASKYSVGLPAILICSLASYQSVATIITCAMNALTYWKWACHTISGPPQKRSPRTVYGRIIGPPWDHPRRLTQSPLTVSGPPSCSLQTVNYEAKKHILESLGCE